MATLSCLAIFLLLLFCICICCPPVWGIVNPYNETAQMVVFLQKPSSLGPRTWAAGIGCLERFTRLYFRKRENLTRSPNLVMTVSKNMATPAAQIQEGFLKVLMEAISEVPSKHKKYQLRIISDSQRYHRGPMHQRALVLADYYILVVDSLKRLKNLMENYVSAMLSWNPGALFLVLYHNKEKQNQPDKMAMDIFQEMLDNFYIHRVALLYATSATQYSFLLMDYYNNTSCRTLKVKKFAECQEGRVVTQSEASLEKRLKKFMNSISLQNCTFYMCASISAPFVESDCLYGLEMRIIGFIKRRLNFNIDQKCELESRGVEETPGNWSGLLGRLNDKDCDFILGGFYPDNDVIRNFWTSDTYLQDAYTWYVKLADPRPAWRALYSIFETHTWLAFIAMLGICWIVWSLVVNLLPEPKNSTELSLTAINSMAVSICVSINERPLCAASRILFFSVALYGLNVTSTYTSKLISVFTNPGFLHQIDTLEEVIEAGIPFGGYEESRDWFENPEDCWIFDQYNYSSIFEPTTMNMIDVKRGERVILSSRMFTLQSPFADDVFAFSHNVFSSPMQMIMKPGFPFVYDFNLMIRYMRDYGLLQKINRDFMTNNTYLNRIAKMRPDFQEKVIVLTTDHLQGPFAILVVGVCSSVFCFLAELLMFYIIYPFCCCCCSVELETAEVKEKKKAKRKSKNNKHKKNNVIVKEKKPYKSDKIRKTKRAHKKSTKEIIVAWNELNVQRDMRLTPMKRRLIRD